MTSNTTMWRFQHDSNTTSDGYPTDARGPRLRAECGYTHVKMNGTTDDGWLQIGVAIRKLEMRERVAALLAA